MKKTKVVLVGLISVGLAANLVSANLLTDPGFENSGSAAWDPGASTNAFEYDFDATAYTRSGVEALEVKWTQPIAQWNLFDAKQTVAVNSGDPWEASVYALVPEAAPVNNAEVYLETIFLDAGMAETGHKLKSDLLPTHTTNQWMQLVNNGTVLAGDVYAKYRLVVFTSLEGGSSSGSLYFDDAEALIPEPATASILGLALLLLRPLVRRNRR
ncbi:MAG: hypothetical protein V1873_06875 [Verrucomicrobiota bacterium]